MTFASRDAFPARGGVGDEGGRFPLGGGGGGSRRGRTAPARATSPYVELHAHSAYSFLDGASLPEELAARAAELGYDALALTDHDGVYGSLEFAHAAKHFGVRPITGAEVSLSGGAHATLLCETYRGYSNLCRILTDAHAGTRVPGRERELLPAETTAEKIAEHAEGLIALSGCARHGLGVVDPNAAARLARSFPGAFYVELQRPYERGDARRNAALTELAETLRVPTVATGDVHAHDRRRVRLQDALVAIKNRTSLDGCERERRGNHESILLAPADMLERLPPEAVHRTREIADRCEFDLTQELGYRYPDFSDGVDPADEQLRVICDRAFADRYAKANGHKKRARERLDDELQLIARLGLAGFFLLHWEVLELARECALEVRGPGSPRHALPPGRGRGSSVGSIVCFLTGLSHVDPVEAGLSLGRFINDAMVAVPDIDLDFPRHSREADRSCHRALRPQARRARCKLFHLPEPRRDPRRREGSRPAVCRLSGSRGSPTDGMRRASPTSSRASPAHTPGRAGTRFAS